MRAALDPGLDRGSKNRTVKQDGGVAHIAATLLVLFSGAAKDSVADGKKKKKKKKKQPGERKRGFHVQPENARRLRVEKCGPGGNI